MAKRRKRNRPFRAPTPKEQKLRTITAKTDDKDLVFVGVPVLGGKVGLGVASFLRALDLLSMSPGCPFRFVWEIVNDKRPVEYARNCLLRTFLTKRELKDAVGIWFVDNDMIPPANVIEMLRVDADIVAGLALAFDHPNENREVASMKVCLFKHNPSNHRFDAVKPQYGDSIIDIDAAGTATMYIKRRVVEDRRMWLEPEYLGLDGETKDYQKEINEKDWAPPIFRTLYKPSGEVLRGEDLDFSWRAKQLGYSVKGHLGCRWGHVKETNLDDILEMMNDTVAKVIEAYGGGNADQGKSEGHKSRTSAVG